jgi:hypothetical protein
MLCRVQGIFCCCDSRAAGQGNKKSLCQMTETEKRKEQRDGSLTSRVPIIHNPNLFDHMFGQMSDQMFNTEAILADRVEIRRF